MRNLDALPEPDYQHFFTTAAELGLPERVLGEWIQLPFESARMLVRAKKHHCTFWGLNRLGMTYRSNRQPACSQSATAWQAGTE